MHWRWARGSSLRHWPALPPQAVWGSAQGGRACQLLAQGREGWARAALLAVCWEEEGQQQQQQLLLQQLPHSFLLTEPLRSSRQGPA